MKNIFLLPWFFARVCWRQGLHKALQMALAQIKSWLGQTNDRFPRRSPSNAAAYVHLLKCRPLISIVMPVYNSCWLAEAVESVRRQSYADWELLLVDDASDNPLTLQVLQSLAAERRVKLLRQARQGGISAATNAALAVATGDYVAFMDHDDLLHHDALALFVRALNAGYEADVFYTDEERLDMQQRIVNSVRKCEVSLDLLLSGNLVGHLCIIRRAALSRLGPLNSAYDGAQDHDLVLRALEQGLRFQHLPLLLYGWRQHGQSFSADIRSAGQAWPRAYLSGKAVIEDYLRRQAIAAQVTDDAFPWYRIRYPLPDPPVEVAIIVPFKDQPERLQTLLDSMARTSYAPYRLFLVNNRSVAAETHAYLERLRADPRLTLLDFDEPFNYSRLHNEVVKKIPNEILLFLNNDMEIIQSDWLEAMLEHIHRPGVGAVGCRLIGPRRTLQHAGLAFNPSVFSCVAQVDAADDFLARVQREVSGVTAACMLIRKSAFEEVGGFDELHFPIGFSDADLCLRLRRSGYKIIYTPFAELLHAASATRGLQDENYEITTLFQRYIGPTPLNDPHYPTQFLRS